MVEIMALYACQRRAASAVSQGLSGGMPALLLGAATDTIVQRDTRICILCRVARLLLRYCSIQEVCTSLCC